MSGSYQAETVFGEIVNIVEKRGGANEAQILVADDGTEFVQDLDNFGLLVVKPSAEDEDGVTEEAADPAATEETPAAAETMSAIGAAELEDDPALD